MRTLSRDVLVRVPGRANLIGDHTDYNEGFVLPMTIEASTEVRARAIGGTEHKITSLRFDESIQIRVGSMPPATKGGWSTYVGGVLLELYQNAGLSEPLQMEIGGTLPLGAGLSSSASLEIAVALGAIKSAGLSGITPENIARIGQQVEHKYAGVKCGIMDQMVCVLGQPKHALLLDCRSLDFKHVPLGGARIVIHDSRVRRQLAASAYNQRRQECEVALVHCRTIDPNIRALRDVPEAELDRYMEGLAQPASMRMEHVVRESGRVLTAAKALEEGDLGTVGAAMNASHESLKTLYEVSCPELDFLVDVARQDPSCKGARMTGGGFGGCTISLVEGGCEDAFATRVSDAYGDAFGIQPHVYIVRNNIGAQISRV